MLKSRLLHPEIQEAIEEATVMEPVTSGPYALKNDPLIWSDFQRILKAGAAGGTLKKLERFAFFDAGKDQNVALTIATGEQRLYANLLLQIGVIFPESVDEPGARAGAL
jgi:L-fucose mutarotase